MTEKDDVGTKSDYEIHGYSARSLEMLESKEGQLNAIFACYGSAAQHGQLFEEALVKLIAVLNECLGIDSTAAALQKKTIGELLKLFEDKFVEEQDDWVFDFLDETRRRRNFLIHDYFLKRSDDMGMDTGRVAVLRELVDIEAQLRRGAGLVNGLRVAIEAARNGEPGRNDDSEVVFTVKLRLPEHQP